MSTLNPKVDAYIRRAKRWRAETEALREILLDCGLTEELKWGKPCYVFEKSNVAIIQGFKEHCALMFFKGVLLDDPHGLLVEQGENTRAALRVEFTEPGQIAKRKKKLQALIRSAIQVEKAGLKVDFESKRELELPTELTDAFDEDPKLKKAFEMLTPGRQRGYILHFSAAKQSKTRAARIERCTERIFEGKGWNER